MNFFEKILYALQAQMNTPKPWGWFHIMWVLLVVISLVILFNLRKKYIYLVFTNVFTVYI